MYRCLSTTYGCSATRTACTWVSKTLHYSLLWVTRKRLGRWLIIHSAKYQSALAHNPSHVPCEPTSQRALSRCGLLPSAPPCKLCDCHLFQAPKRFQQRSTKPTLRATLLKALRPAPRRVWLPFDCWSYISWRWRMHLENSRQRHRLTLRPHLIGLSHGGNPVHPPPSALASYPHLCPHPTSLPFRPLASSPLPHPNHGAASLCARSCATRAAPPHSSWAR